MDNVKFGVFIAQERKKRGLTQRNIAEMLDVTNKAVSKWERGKSFPDVELLMPLSIVLEVSIEELMASGKN